MHCLKTMIYFGPKPAPVTAPPAPEIIRPASPWASPTSTEIGRPITPTPATPPPETTMPAHADRPSGLAVTQTHTEEEQKAHYPAASAAAPACSL